MSCWFNVALGSAHQSGDGSGTLIETPRCIAGRAVAAAALIALLGCTGEIDNGYTAHGAGASGTSHGGSGQGGGSSTAGSSGVGATPGGSAGTAAVPVDPGTKDVHRLNAAEYNATVADVLGTALQPADSSWRGGELGGFDNMASVLGVDEDLYARYFETAARIADDVFANPTLKSRLVTCDRVDEAACVQNIIGATGLRLFRRPLSTEEVATYQNVYVAARGLGESHDDSLEQVLRALLSSAEFLFRVELDPPNSMEKHALTGYELASRLSYFVWSSAPDDALLNAARDGSLLKDDTLTASVDRMLADPVKSRRLVENFSGQWLGARKVPEHAVDRTVYPDWSPQMATALTQEMYAYFAEFLKTDASWFDFLKADVNFVSADTARLYGTPAPSGAGLSRAELTTDTRHGFFGLGGFLALSSLDRRTSPTLRGRWILMNLLCTEPPPPSPDVPDLDAGATDPTQNVRQALEEHRKNPQCAGCHTLFDPYGLSLEQFDAIGRYRTTYPDAARIDPATELPSSDLYPNGRKFSGLEGLSETVSADPKYAECVADNLFSYAVGRVVTAADRPYLHQVQNQWRGGAPSLRRLIRSIVSSEAFRYRRPNLNLSRSMP